MKRGANTNQQYHLTKEQIDDAKKDRNHVVISTFDDMLENWKTLMPILRSETVTKERQKLCDAAFLPFAEGLEDKDIPINPLKLVSIWNRAMEVFPDMASTNRCVGYALSKSIAYSHGSNVIDLPRWKHLFRKTLSDTEYLKNVAMRDRDEAQVFGVRLNDIGVGIRHLERYHGSDNGHDDKVVTAVYESFITCIIAMSASLAQPPRRELR